MCQHGAEAPGLGAVLPLFRGLTSFAWWLAAETDQGLSESSIAFAQAGLETQGVVSLAHSLLFGCLWQQDPNNLNMCLYKKTWEWNPQQEFGAVQMVEGAELR